MNRKLSTNRLLFQEPPDFNFSEVYLDKLTDEEFNQLNWANMEWEYEDNFKPFFKLLDSYGLLHQFVSCAKRYKQMYEDYGDLINADERTLMNAFDYRIAF